MSDDHATEFVMSALEEFASRPARSADPTDYDRFAAIYNRWIGEDFAKRTRAAIQRLLMQHLARGAEVLDVCCGCGHFAGVLADLGYGVTGLDASAKMLEFAREKVPEAVWVQGDVRAFTFPRQFDAVISTFNSFAHVRTEELDDVFRCVRAALRGGGVFLFDLTMEEAYVARWRGTFAVVAHDYACVVRPIYQAATKTATNFVAAFERDARKGAINSRSDFLIVQHCHDRADVQAALARAGFDCVQMLDGQHDLGIGGEAGRAFFLCK